MIQIQKQLLFLIEYAYISYICPSKYILYFGGKNKKKINRKDKLY